MLVDCGCDLHGYVSDVTRTWPVSGKCVVSQCQSAGKLLRVYCKLLLSLEFVNVTVL